ncbi:MAG: AAA family ATPase [Saccharofermentanales bacterium]
MLLEFRVKNFKSFKDEIIFKMTPAPKIKDMDYSIFNHKINKKTYKALPAAVIYGANSSGKTNLIGAMEVLRKIVLTGDIKNSEASISPNISVSKMEFIPNIKNSTAEPICFLIKFISGENLYEYTLDINIGKFLDSKFKREIIREKLVINEKMIFNRAESLEIGDIGSIKTETIKGFNDTMSENIAKNNLNREELFLTTFFKTLYSAKIAKSIHNWFNDNFLIIYRADIVHTLPDDIVLKEKKFIIDDEINHALKLFGLCGEKIAYARSNKSNEVEQYSILNIENNRTVKIPVEIFESFGTVRFLNIFPLIVDAIKNGKTLVIDEFDASIHPMALMSIVNIFHNNDINTKEAQLIFNTHNPIFLNKNTFRRDEIKFVERDDETGISTHYSLSDFGTSGENGVRNSSDYMKNYFINQYGAIRNIDFTDVFTKSDE